jgi:hypothetical protein
MVHTGSCLCGGVRYRAYGPLRAVIACHCAQCRKTSGHHSAMTSVTNDKLSLESSDSLVWYRSSATAQRGFCKVCGGNLFWRPEGEGRTSIAAGTLDSPTHLTIAEHIFVADKGDYYEISET